MRALSWGVMGLLIGMGQGLADNTREDFRACALGGQAGGALFNPVSEITVLGSGLPALAAADVIVGATIGGSMACTDRAGRAVRQTENHDACDSAGAAAGCRIAGRREARTREARR